MQSFAHLDLIVGQTHIHQTRGGVRLLTVADDSVPAHKREERLRS